MKLLRNKKGSALLWTILLTVIITILLGAILTATYAYFNYTMYTVKRQQAYFTARSATDAVIDSFANVKLIEKDGQIVEAEPELLPEPGKTITVENFGLPDKMGSASGKIYCKKNEPDIVNISVKATFADEDYELKTRVARQPLYFAGIAIKELNLNGSTLTIGKGTDLYWNNDQCFDPRVNSGYDARFGGAGVAAGSQNPTSKINIGGNLVTKKDATIPAGSSVAGHRFDLSLIHI